MSDEVFNTEGRNLHTAVSRITLEINDLEIVVTEEATKAANNLSVSIRDVYNPSQTSSQIIFFNDRINFSICLSFISNLLSQYTNTNDYNQKELERKTVITSSLPESDEFKDITNSKAYSYTPQLYIIVKNTADELTDDHIIDIFDRVIEIKNTGTPEQTDKIIIETDSIPVGSLRNVTKILGVTPDNITLAAKVIEETRKTITPSR